MKKYFVLTILYIVSAFSPVMAAMEKGLDGKIGTAYVTDPEKFGLNIMADYYVVPDPYLACGFETGLNWTKWERTIGRKLVNPPNPLEADVKADSNAYIIPALAMAQIRMPHLEEKYSVIPYLNIGLGLSFMALKYKQPDYTTPDGTVYSSKNETDWYKGFTWQVLFGVAYQPGPDSKIDLLMELGYRSMKLEKNSIEVDMSGFVALIGVRFPFESPDN